MSPPHKFLPNLTAACTQAWDKEPAGQYHITYSSNSKKKNNDPAGHHRGGRRAAPFKMVHLVKRYRDIDVT
jgi:hypothetical protein